MTRDEIKSLFKKEYKYDGAFSQDVDFTIDFIYNRFDIIKKDTRALEPLSEERVKEVAWNSQSNINQQRGYND